jgi:phage shock protein A
MAPLRASLWREEMMGKITPLFGSHTGEPRREGDEPIASRHIDEMTAHLATAKDQLAASQKEERRLATQAEVMARGASEWETRAMAAVRAGDDVVARDALLRKRQHELDYERVRAAERDQHQQTATLTRALVTLNFRIEEVSQQRQASVVRREPSEAPPLLEQGGVEALGTNADAMLKRLEAKMSDIEAELELSDETMKKLAREAGDALRTQEEQSRLKREATAPPPFASKPLAKTQPSDPAGADTPPSQAVGLTGPQRTKH